MALQTSGAISLNQIHVEAGGSSGSAVSMNDADVRGLISKGSGASMAFNEWYGASSSLDTQTVTVGSFRLNSLTPYSYGYFGSSGGSISDGTSNMYSGILYKQINWWHYGTITLIITGHQSNSGWATMKIGSTTLNRSSASYSQSSSGLEVTAWNWTSQSTNLFGTTVGATVAVVFN